MEAGKKSLKTDGSVCNLEGAKALPCNHLNCSSAEYLSVGRWGGGGAGGLGGGVRTIIYSFIKNIWIEALS